MEQSTGGNPKLMRSPNLVLANVLNRTIDLLAPTIFARRPQKAIFVVGTQINGAPHFGTHLVQATAFALARLASRRFSIDTSVQFVALDNSPHEITCDLRSGHQYQRTWHHALGSERVTTLIDRHYVPFLDGLSVATGIAYQLITYTDQQATRKFRETFLSSIDSLDEIRWWLAPSQGQVHLRVPCPSCGWAEKRAERTRILRHDNGYAAIAAHCLHHGEYGVEIGSDGGAYLDLSTLYRNLVKERSGAGEADTLQVMVKGGDWTYACQLVDGAHVAMGTPEGQLPVRMFAPQILSASGAKLSKSLLNAKGYTRPNDVTDWMLDATLWPGPLDDYIESMLWLVDKCAEDPRDFFRSFTIEEIARLWGLGPSPIAIRSRSQSEIRA